MNTYSLDLSLSDVGQNEVKFRLGYASAPEIATVSIASYGAVDIRIVRNKKNGDVYLATNEKLTAAGVPYTGDADTDEILDLFPDILERTKRSEAGHTKTYSLEELAAEYGIEL